MDIFRVVRDCHLKPSKVLLDLEMNTYVRDFGLVRFMCAGLLVQLQPQLILVLYKFAQPKRFIG